MRTPPALTPVAPVGEQNAPGVTAFGDGAGEVAGGEVTERVVGTGATTGRGAVAGAALDPTVGWRAAGAVLGGSVGGLVTGSVVAAVVDDASVVSGASVVVVTARLVDVLDAGAAMTVSRTGTVVDGDLPPVALLIAARPPIAATPPTTPTRTFRRGDMPCAGAGTETVAVPGRVGGGSAPPF